MSGPNYIRYLSWNGQDGHGPFELRSWLLERLPYEIIVPDQKVYQNIGDLREIDAETTDLWSAYAEGTYGARFFFKNESDAIAFKLKRF